MKTGVNTSRAIMLMLLANFSFCIMVCLVKSLHATNSWITVLFRFAVGISVVSIAAMIGKSKLSFVDGKGLVLRGFTGATAVLISFLSISKLGIIKSAFISNSFPLFATLFGAIILKEKMTLANMGGLLFAFLGIGILVIGDNHEALQLSGFTLYEIIALIGAALGGLATVQVKQLHKTESSIAIFYAQCIAGLWISIVPAVSTPGIIGGSTALILLGVGITAASGQMLFTVAVKELTVMTSSLLIMTSPVINVLAGSLFFHETLTVSMILGGSIVILSTLVSLKFTSA